MGYLQSKLFGDHCVNQLVRPSAAPVRGREGLYRVISYLRRIFLGLICPPKHTKEINVT